MGKHAQVASLSTHTRKGGSTTDWSAAGTDSHAVDPEKYRRVVGVVSIPNTGASGGTSFVDVTFGFSFANTPLILNSMMNPDSFAHLQTWITNRTVSGFRLNFVNWHGGATTGGTWAWSAEGEVA